jgi:hypothetical protein
MSKETDLDTQPTGKTLPWFLTITGLLTIGGLIAMPFLAGEPDGDKMPDMVRFLGRFHDLYLEPRVRALVQRGLGFALVLLLLAMVAAMVLVRAGSRDAVKPLASVAYSWMGVAF